MNRNAVQVKWYGINALEFRHGNGSFMIDPYVSRNREKLTVPANKQKLHLIGENAFRTVIT